ncbi:glycosyltransferase [Winogradskyella bathintestinalis]|uniref:Glycosyltransferase n=1 Tax=Winogradskyella bathintestinalis TaxID=3035208 RepID=A0ABT7ZSS7_9FLAO|nr:glycosyltransferase [Winogradskyella bathintestinalis]MDN3492050.1 glycosyltransferase [Winogradskyella bathintestinalis]
MKILYLIEELGGGGKERRLVELLKGLSENRDYEVFLVLTKRTNKYPEINQLPINIHSLNGYSNFALIRQYFLILKKIKPNVIHTWSFKTSFYIALLKPLFTFKFIAGFIGDTFGFSKIKSLVGKQFIFKRADSVVSNSQLGLDAYHVPKTKGVVIYNGFDFNRISKSKISQLEGIGIKTPLKIVMLANVTKYKNYRLFIDIAEYFVKHRNDITFISIGEILPEFKSLVAPYINNNHSQIKFLGFRQDVSDLIKDCQIGLLCTYTEGISNSIIELMANGVPVVTNDLKGGTREVISNDIDGIICNDNKMVNSLQELIKDENLRETYSKNASCKIASDFTLTKMVFNYIKIYN